MAEDKLGCVVLRQASILQDLLKMSVVVPNFNTAGYLHDSVTSVLDQSLDCLEVIVVDDGSTDESQAVLSKIIDDRLTCVYQENRGLAGARNTGIRLARTNLIGFCDSDDIWYPQKAQEHVNLHQEDPDIGVSFSYSAYITETGDPTGNLLISTHNRPSLKDLLRRNHVGNGSTPVVRRRCFEREGGFDESLKTNEDYDMWIRIASGSPSHQFCLVPEVLTGYRIRTSSLSFNFDQFLSDGYQMTRRLKDKIEGIGDREINQCYAGILRIASRKALVEEQYGLSRRFLRYAIRIAPTLPLYDRRALALILFHVFCLPLPPRLRRTAFSTANSILARAIQTFSR